MFFNKLKKEIESVQLRHSHGFSYVQVLKKPDVWQCMGLGNSAAVFRHDSYPDVAIKVFSDICTHIASQESEVYRRLGNSCFYPKFYGNGENFLLLQYIPGLSAYDCLLKGIYIPEQIVFNIDEAVSFARQQGLNPRNLHAKNILIHEERGYLVDVSEYMYTGNCYHWDVLKFLYYNFYSRFWKPGMKFPFWMLEFIRRGYRLFHMTRGIFQPAQERTGLKDRGGT
ncbi:MAG: serine/threonine protein kinase [Desulfobacterales bacterium]|nr:serine/threonine protein kinase [Desulfobacterales bacterium]